MQILYIIISISIVDKKTDLMSLVSGGGSIEPGSYRLLGFFALGL
jgi:hypothetical protein